MPGPHIVGIRGTQVLVETIVHRQEGLQVPQVPLAVHGRGIILLLQQFGDGHLIRIDAGL